MASLMLWAVFDVGDIFMMRELKNESVTNIPNLSPTYFVSEIELRRFAENYPTILIEFIS